MAVRLKPVDATNWAAMIELRVLDAQETFVAPPVKSLAMCYVRGWGEQYDYRPFVICNDSDQVVGYVTLVSDPKTPDDYWVDDIMIAAAHQGKGYGRAALDLALRFILREYPRCEMVQLCCYRANLNAAALYKSVGFVNNGKLSPGHDEPEYELSGAPLAKFRK